jgi:hypothetical protein
MAWDDRCFNRLVSAIILKDATPQQVNRYIRKMCREYYPLNPPFEFRGVSILLESPMLLGILPGGRKILMPFSKPCYGTVLGEIDGERGEVASLRRALGSDGTARRKKKYPLHPPR